MKLSPNNLFIINLLRDKNLHYLIKPFKLLIELDKLGKISIHKMTWKVIMREVHSEDITRSDLEKLITSYLVNFGVVVEKKKRIEKRISKDRVKNHREHKKALGYKTVSIQLSPKVYEKFKKKSNDLGLSYADLIEKLL